MSRYRWEGAGSELNRLGAEGWPGREGRKWRRPGERSSGSSDRPCRVCNVKGHDMWDCVDRCNSGCLRCGGNDHRVYDCKEPFAGQEDQGGTGYDRPSTPAREGRQVDKGDR